MTYIILLFTTSVILINQVLAGNSCPCGPNEEYRICKQTCPPDTCFSLVARFDCSQEPPCKPGCVCKSSFLRAKPNSPCIPMRQCPELANSPDFD